MNELIKIEEAVISSEKVNAVSARELHKLLGVRSHYKDWIRNRLTKYDFQEGIDFCCLAKTLATQTEGGRSGSSTYTDHLITLDVAKELCMVENNAKGREARRYFIECEKQLRQALSVEDSLILGIIRADDIESRMLAMSDYRNTIVVPLQNKVQEQAVVIEEQTQVIEEAKPKVEFYNLAMETESTVDMKQAAKILDLDSLGRNRLFAYLRSKGILDAKNQPYQEYIDKGWFKLVEVPAYNDKEGAFIHIKTVVKQKGLDGISKLLLKDGFSPRGVREHIRNKEISNE